MHSTTLSALAWSAGWQAAQQEEPIVTSLLEQGFAWSQHILLPLQLPLSVELGATAAWNFYQGARFFLRGDSAAQHPHVPTGAWCGLFWPVLQLASVAEAAGCVTAGEYAGEVAARQAVELERVILDDDALWNLARLSAVTACPHTAHLNPAEQVSAFSDGFFCTYWVRAGRWSARTFLVSAPSNTLLVRWPLEASGA